MTSRRTLLFFITLIITYIMAINASYAKTAEITGINVQEVNGSTEIQIDSDSQMSYTLYNPADPYRVVVEIQDIGLGSFTEKIVVDRAGVMEIIPSEIEGMANSVKLEIILTVPADVEPIQREKTLILTFNNPEADAPAAASHSMEDAGVKDAAVVESIEISKAKNRVYVLISGDGKMYPEAHSSGTDKLIVDIPGVSTSVESLGTYAPPVMGVRVAEEPDGVRIVFDLSDDAKHNISSQGSMVIVSFEGSGEDAYGADLPKKFSGSAFIKGEYTGERISIDFQDADLVHIFRLLADVSGYNIVVAPGVKGSFSMKLENVPWDQALDIILRNYGLSKIVEDNIIRIAPTAAVAAEEALIAKVKDAALMSGDLVSRVYAINYADVDDIKSAINDAKLLSSRGFIGTDERTSSVIIKDVESMHPEFQKIIALLDKATPQVSIEARIVEVTTNFTRELGIQWGVLWQPTPQTAIGGVNGLSGGSGFFGGSPFSVNLPAAVGAGTGGNFGFGYISAQDLRALDIQLSAMESSGNGRIVSNPRIITMDNQQAKIKQGKSIPYRTSSPDTGAVTAFVDADIELVVTPHITPDDTIVMEVKTKKNEADFSQVGEDGAPSIDTKEAETQVLIKNGDTLVLGGVFKTNKSKSVSEVPLLGKIPILGWLFKKEKVIEDTTELLIFITPRIIVTE